jgi:hypothetical protein
LLLVLLASAVILRFESRGTMPKLYCLNFETPLNWRVSSPYLYPTGTRRHSFTPRHWVPFSLSPTTLRATVEVFEPASTRVTIFLLQLSSSLLFLHRLSRKHRCQQYLYSMRTVAKGIFLPSRCLETALVYLIISRCGLYTLQYLQSPALGSRMRREIQQLGANYSSQLDFRLLSFI